MDVIKKLAKIEDTAEAIVAGAEQKKFDIEKEIQEKRNAFDAEVEAKVQEEVERIRAEGKAKLDKALEEGRAQHRSEIDQLEKDFAEHHTEYAKNVLKKILEV